MGLDTVSITVMDLHRVGLEELCERFHTNLETGLHNTQAHKSLLKYGPNILTVHQSRATHWEKLYKCFFEESLRYLWFGDILCFISYILLLCLYEEPPWEIFYLGILVTATVLGAGLFFYIHIIRIEDFKLKAYQEMLPRNAIVRRDGKQVIVKTIDVTLGDIVELEGYDNRCPADLRVIQSNNFKVRFLHSVTGTFDALTKSSQFTDEDPLKTENLVFGASRVEDGSMVGLVVAVANNTILRNALVRDVANEWSDLTLCYGDYFMRTGVSAVFVGVTLVLGRFMLVLFRMVS